MLRLERVTKEFRTRQGRIVHAVEDVSLTVPENKTVALVGESGCGKTTIAKLILKLERPTAGRVLFEGRDLAEMDRSALHAYRRQVQAVFQDPYASLNPRLRVGTIVAEPILAHVRGDRRAVDRRVEEALGVVGLPVSAARLFPHEFSGGQRQRIAIARALALRPRLMVLDEPVSALDVSIRAQILNLLSDIQAEYRLAYLLITHDLALVEHFSTAVAVVYLGRVVEAGPTESLFDAPAHPYTQLLIESAPQPDPDHRLPEIAALGEVAGSIDRPSGCHFHPRCPYVMPECRATSPALTSRGQDRLAACHLARLPAAPTPEIVRT
jgi:oligopeptide/dipeptide ABC transporter ATP-binding protein